MPSTVSVHLLLLMLVSLCARLDISDQSAKGGGSLPVEGMTRAAPLPSFPPRLIGAQTSGGVSRRKVRSARCNHGSLRRARCGEVHGRRRPGVEGEVNSANLSEGKLGKSYCRKEHGSKAGRPPCMKGTDEGSQAPGRTTQTNTHQPTRDDRGLRLRLGLQPGSNTAANAGHGAETWGRKRSRTSVVPARCPSSSPPLPAAFPVPHLVIAPDHSPLPFPPFPSILSPPTRHPTHPPPPPFTIYPAATLASPRLSPPSVSRKTCLTTS